MDTFKFAMDGAIGEGLIVGRHGPYVIVEGVGLDRGIHFVNGAGYVRRFPNFQLATDFAMDMASDKMATDPLTSKGTEIKANMEKEYGPEKGEKVFYASKNKGTISGVDKELDEEAEDEDCDITKDGEPGLLVHTDHVKTEKKVDAPAGAQAANAFKSRT